MQPAETPVWRPKFAIDPATPVATVGGGLAQAMTGALRRHGFNLLDLEPPPPGLAGEVARQFGHLLFSARYGTIATPRQFAQLVAEAFDGAPHPDCVDASGGRFHDAFRPSVEPSGLATADRVLAHRRQHLLRVQMLVRQAGVLFFALGTPQAWIDRETRHVYPQKPAGAARSGCVLRPFAPEAIVRQLGALRGLLRQHTPSVRLLLAVEEPDAALHAAVRQFAGEHADADYLPGTDATALTRLFFASLSGDAALADKPPEDGQAPPRRARKRRPRKDADGIVCEEILLEAFSR